MTANIMRKNRNDISKISNEFSNQLDQISEDENVHSAFMSAAFNLMLHITKCRQTQDALLDLVLDSQHGKINPLLLSPEQFARQISIIQGHIPTSVKIPGYKAGENLSSVYKIISTRARVMKSKIIIEVSIPLINVEQFQLFNLVPITTTQNNHSVSIKPSAKYLATTLDRGKYWIMDEIDFRACRSTKSKEYICDSNRPLYTSNSKVAECEIKLLSHAKEFARTCKVMIVPEQKSVSWVKLNSGNTWILHAPMPQAIDVICEDKLHSVSVSGTVKVELFRGCQIKHESTIIHAHEVYSSSLNSSFNPSLNIHREPALQRLNTTRISFVNQGSMDLEELDKYISQQDNSVHKPLGHAISSHDIHQFIALYITIFVMLIVVCWYVYNRYVIDWCRSKKSRKGNQVDDQKSDPSPFHISLEDMDKK